MIEKDADPRDDEIERLKAIIKEAIELLEYDDIDFCQAENALHVLRGGD